MGCDLFLRPKGIGMPFIFHMLYTQRKQKSCIRIVGEDVSLCG